jgi:MFS family permease
VIGLFPEKHQKWVIVFAVFVITAMCSGLGFFSLPIFLRELSERNAFSVSIVSVSTSFFFVVVGICFLFVGRLIERFDIRLTLCGGGAAAAAGISIIGNSHDTVLLFAGYAVLAVGFAATSFVPGTALVTRWFPENRSLAIAIATTGLSAGGIVLAPLTATLIDAYGLSNAAYWLGGIYFAGVVPTAFFLVRPWPGARQEADTRVEGLGYAKAVRTRFFIFVTLAYVLCQTAQVGGIAHHFKLVADRTHHDIATLSITVLAASSLVGRLAGGWILKYVSIRWFTIAIYLGQVSALALLSWVDTTTSLLVTTALFGATNSNVLNLMPITLAQVFGVPEFSSFGIAAGPAVLGFFYDWWGNYLLPYGVAASVSAVSLVAFIAAGPVGTVSNDQPGSPDLG